MTVRFCSRVFLSTIVLLLSSSRIVAAARLGADEWKRFDQLERSFADMSEKASKALEPLSDSGTSSAACLNNVRLDAESGRLTASTIEYLVQLSARMVDDRDENTVNRTLVDELDLELDEWKLTGEIVSKFELMCSDDRSVTSRLNDEHVLIDEFMREMSMTRAELPR